MIEELLTDTGGAQMIDAGENVWKWVAAAAVTLVTTLLGLAYKNRSTSQGLEDATNKTTIETLATQRERIRELEDQVRGLFEELQAVNRALLDSEAVASRARVNAELAENAAARATEAAQAARNEANRAHDIARARKQHIMALRAIIVEGGLPLPEQPE